ALCLRRPRRLPRSRDPRGRPPARLLTEPLEPRRCNHGVRKPLIVVVAAVCAWPAQALAKGPDYASISGPGIHGSIRIDGDGESGTDTPLGAFVTYGGYPAQVFGPPPQSHTPPRQPRPRLPGLLLGPDPERAAVDSRRCLPIRNPTRGHVHEARTAVLRVGANARRLVRRASWAEAHTRRCRAARNH